MPMGSVRGKVILYFANCNNYHTYKWAAYFAGAGCSVHVASLEKPSRGNVGEVDGVTVHWLSNPSRRQGSDGQKLGYLKTVSQARQLIDDLNPDIVHAHYASSYGTICSLSCKRPYYLSVWGSDVYDFPRKSLVHRLIFKHALNCCTWLMSTSEAMAKETRKYTDKAISITPFGVDMNLFNPDKASGHSGFVVGTVKGLEQKYGIETLLRSCKMVHDARPDLNLRVRIAGTGTLEQHLHALSYELKMSDYVDWLGFIPQDQAAREWASMDVALVPSESESESFGVSAVEAQASGVPLIITDIPGLMEACAAGRTAKVVRRGDVAELASAIELLADDPAQRRAMSKRALDYVRQTYEYSSCFEHIQEIYECNPSVRR